MDFEFNSIASEIEYMKSVGFGFIPGMLCAPFLADLRQEIAGLSFRKAAPLVGSVRQDFEQCAFLHSIPRNPRLEALRAATEEFVRRGGFPRWTALEVAINRYEHGGGLSAHRDFARHPDVIVVWNVAGSCRFELLASRAGPVIQDYELVPGDLILLRGTMGDLPRPVHRVAYVADYEPRISVTIRDDKQPGELIGSFFYANA